MQKQTEPSLPQPQVPSTVTKSPLLLRVVGELKELGAEAVTQKAIACRDIKEAATAPTMNAAVEAFGLTTVRVSVLAVCTKAMEAFAPKRRMDPDNIMVFVERLVSDWPLESMEDIGYFMHRCSMSAFDDGEYYSSVDVPRMIKWWQTYLEQKAGVLEQIGEREEADAAMHLNTVAQMVAGDKLSEVIRKFNLEGRLAKTAADAVEIRRRLEKDVARMSEAELRDAYALHTGADERSIIMGEATRRQDPAHAAMALAGFAEVDRQVIALFESRKKELVAQAHDMLQRMKVAPERIQVIMTPVPMDIATYSTKDRRFIFIEASVLALADGTFTRAGIEYASPSDISKRLIRLS